MADDFEEFEIKLIDRFENYKYKKTNLNWL